jgi:hypothetical protein
MIFPAKKIVGWLVIFFGLLIMFLSIYYSYLYFTAKAEFPTLFKQPEIQTESLQTPPQTADPASLNIDMQSLTNQAMSQAVSGMIPPDAIAKLLNMAGWSVFSFFLIVAGSYLAGIGIKLLTAKEK